MKINLEYEVIFDKILEKGYSKTKQFYQNMIV